MNEQKIKKSRASIGKNNKRKGSNYERLWVKRFKDIGYSFAKTSRLASRLLDNSNVDVAFIPYNLQCKNVKANIKYTEIFKEIEEDLKKNFPPHDVQHTYPIVIAHKRGRTKDEEHVIMKAEDFIKLVKSQQLVDKYIETYYIKNESNNT